MWRNTMSNLVQRLREIDSEFGFTLCATAADRIEALERENEVNERNVSQLIDDLSAARRENAELRKDAERYRWARNALADKEKGVSHWFFCVGCSEELDAAIDEAMKS